MQLTMNGRPLAAILIARDASDTEKFAAAELRKYLRKISGARLPIRRTRMPPLRSVAPQPGTIMIGKSPQLRADDSFAIEVSEDQARLQGRDDTGVLYSVYTFLEICLGVRWLLPGADGEYIPARKNLCVAPVRLTEEPAFKRRMIAPLPQTMGNLALLRKIIDQMPKLKLNYLLLFAGSYNFYRYSVEWDAIRAALLPEINKRSIKIDLGHHCFDYFLPAEKYFKTHPEYFALIKGRRQAEHAQFCTRNPEAVAVFRDNVIGYLKRHPEVGVISLFPNDYHGFCECRRCRAISPERRVLDLVFTVAQAVRKAAPRVQVAHLAYTLYDLKPPAQMRFPPNVLLYFAPWHRCYAHAFYDPHCRINRPYARALKQWTRLCRGGVVFYDYYVTVNFSTNMLVPFAELISADLRQHQRARLAGMVNSFSEIRNWLTYSLNLYVYAKTLWNPQYDPRALRREFCRACFGSAWRQMDKIFALLERIRRYEENYIKVDVLSRGMADLENTGKQEITAAKAIRDLGNIVTQMAQVRRAAGRALCIAKDVVIKKRIRQIGLNLLFSMRQMEQLQRVFRLKELYWQHRNTRVAKACGCLLNSMRREYVQIQKDTVAMDALFRKHKTDMQGVASCSYFRRQQKGLHSICRQWLGKLPLR